VAVAIDVPDEDGLGRELASVDDRPRIDRPHAPLELVAGSRAVVDQNLGVRRKDAVVGRVDHQGWFHLLPLMQV
jgi:hypothetical protein